jgi:erythronate-4-phosphate dehydrogenase
MFTMGSVRIVADENIPYVREAFGSLGHVDLVAGPAMTLALLKEADLLLVRSVTQVNENLLADSAVKFVATATIGTDHVDESYLARHRITFVSAAGSNSSSVSEYIIAALLTVARRKCFTLAGKTIGVVGVGNVGSKVAEKCRQLGLTVLKNDPPLRERTGSDEYRELPELLESCDLLTMHVPLTKGGRWPTYHMVSESLLARLKPSAFLLNSSRGAVVDEAALRQTLSAGRLAGAVLDVWEHEPSIDASLLKLAELGTPHIAGYSFDGKVNGTEMIYQAACRFLGVSPAWNPKAVLPAPTVRVISLTGSGDFEADLLSVIRRVYDIESDDARLRELLTMAGPEGAKHFDLLRKRYAVRREFFNTCVELEARCDPQLRTALAGLGFQIQ